MRYWRHYPKFLQVVLLMLLISFSIAISSFICSKVYGVSLESIPSLANKNIIHAAQLKQAISSLFRFLLSALLFAYLAHPQPKQYLGMHAIRKPNYIFIALLLLFGAVPLINQLSAWIKLIDFGAAIKTAFKEQQKMIQSMMSDTGTGQLLLYLLLFAALPAIGEELMFRGVVMRFAHQSSHNIHYAIVLSALVFGLAHGTLYNFLPISLAGVLLGYLYYWSGSIWVSIIAHFINNAIAILGLYLSNTGIISKELSDAENLPWYVLLISALLFILALQLARKNATPLAAQWSNDFAEQ